MYRQCFGIGRFVAEPSQFGGTNIEGLRSGAFWFYYRLGFRPVESDAARRAEDEWSRMRADPRLSDAAVPTAAIHRVRHRTAHRVGAGGRDRRLERPRHLLDRRAIRRRSRARRCDAALRSVDRMLGTRTARAGRRTSGTPSKRSRRSSRSCRVLPHGRRPTSEASSSCCAPRVATSSAFTTGCDAIADCATRSSNWDPLQPAGERTIG